MNTSASLARDFAWYARHIALGELYQSYAHCLDSGDLTAWPGFFTDDGIYRAQGRENYDRGLPLAAIACEGQGMLLDRVNVILNVMVYAPRYIQHVVAQPQVVSENGSELLARASFSVFHTLPHEPTALLSVGRYEDTLAVMADGTWKFKQRLAIYDTLLIPGSLVYPL